MQTRDYGCFVLKEDSKTRKHKKIRKGRKKKTTSSEREAMSGSYGGYRQPLRIFRPRQALWLRLVGHVVKLERDAAFETANRLYNEEHGSVETQKIPRCPSEHERMEHELTHIPYRDWCEFCIQCKAKSDSPGTTSHGSWTA